MQFKDFEHFIKEQEVFLRTAKHKDFTEREVILTRLAKIAEEFGELADEVLMTLGDQRSGKTNGHTEEDLADEFADVVITTFLLAETMDIDVMEALGKKIEKIKAKHNKELQSGD